MLSRGLRLVGGIEFSPGVARQSLPDQQAARGWPLSAELLAALQSASPERRRIGENQMRALLGLSLLDPL